MGARLLAAALLAGGLAGCAGLQAGAGSGSVWLAPEWDVEGSGRDARRIVGYVHNTHGVAARDVQLLVEALDAREQVVARRLTWVMGGVPANNRAYFEVRNLPPAAQYRVSVVTVTFDQGSGSPVFRF